MAQQFGAVLAVGGVRAGAQDAGDVGGCACLLGELCGGGQQLVCAVVPAELVGGERCAGVPRAEGGVGADRAEQLAGGEEVFQRLAVAALEQAQLPAGGERHCGLGGLHGG